MFSMLMILNIDTEIKISQNYKILRKLLNYFYLYLLLPHDNLLSTKQRLSFLITTFLTINLYLLFIWQILKVTSSGY